MEIKLTLALPRDGMSVPVVRRVLQGSLHVLGVHDDVVSDIVLALTEACTNVLEHAAAGHEYEVSAGIHGRECVIEVIDTGDGFAADRQGFEDAAADAEGGRGIQLMRALVDRVSFTRKAGQGSVVHLEKRLTWEDGSVMSRLTDGQAPTTAGPWSADERLSDVPKPIPGPPVG